MQIEYGLHEKGLVGGVFPGNSSDPSELTGIADVVQEKFGLAQMVMVSDRN